MKLLIVPNIIAMNSSSSLQVIGKDGISPYRYIILSGDGNIEGAIYYPSYPGIKICEVIDGVNNTSMAPLYVIENLVTISKNFIKILYD